MEQQSMTVDQLYEYILKYLTPEEALKRLLAGMVQDYNFLRTQDPKGGGCPEIIITAAAAELGWRVMVENQEDGSQPVRGLAVGTEEYLDALVGIKDTNLVKEVYTKYDDLQVDNILMGDVGMKIQWSNSKDEFGELTIVKLPSGEISIDDECMSSDFCKALLSKVIDKYRK